MSTSPERWVRKVHPATRAAEPEDPFTLHATPVPGDPEEMLRCLVQEYAGMGWDAEEILTLFRDPFYPALNALYHLYGEPGLRQRLAAALRQTAVFRVRAVVREESEPPAPELELIPLGIRTRPRKGESHAEGL